MALLKSQLGMVVVGEGLMFITIVYPWFGKKRGNRNTFHEAQKPSPAPESTGKPGRTFDSVQTWLLGLGGCLLYVNLSVGLPRQWLRGRCLVTLDVEKGHQGHLSTISRQSLTCKPRRPQAQKKTLAPQGSLEIQGTAWLSSASGTRWELAGGTDSSV